MGFRVGAFVFIAGYLMVGCGSEDHLPDFSTDPAQRDQHLAQARAYKGETQFWAGPAVAGLDIDDAYFETRKIHENSQWSFFYGVCDAFVTEDEEHQTICNPPLEIQNWSICGRWPNKFPNPKIKDFRGAKAVWYGSIGAFQVYTGRSTVVIFSNFKRAQQVAAGLRPISSDKPVRRLEPPAPGALAGRLPCQAGIKLHNP